MRFPLKNINLIFLLFICFIITLFVNCSGVDNPMENFASQSEDGQTTTDISNSGSSTTTETTTTTDADSTIEDSNNEEENTNTDTTTTTIGDGSDTDVSDFSWDKVTWITDEINVSGWSETSQITSIEVTQRGALCVDHTKKDDWPDGNEVAWATNKPLIASLWAIVKLDGKYYAGTWELATRGETCKFGHYNPNETLSNIYERVWREHFKSGRLTSWKPRGGDVVGFMASGIARHLHYHSIQERSNIQWYRLPSVDGSISGQMLGTYSSQNNN